MTLTEASSSPEDREHPIEFPLLEKLVGYVKETDPKVLKKELLTKAEESPHVDLTLITDAINFMEKVHKGDERKYHHEGETPKPFITHTLATALMVFELMQDKLKGDEQSQKDFSDAIAVALLHDAIEDGRMPEEGKPEIRKEDLIEAGFSQRIADAVEVLSNVRESETPGGKRRPLSHEEYFGNIRAAKDNRELQNLGLEVIKACDRSTNVLDPFRKVKLEHGVLYQRSQPGQDTSAKKKKDAYTSRRDHIENTQTYLYLLLNDNQRASNYMHAVIDLADLTCQPRFIRTLWKTQLKFKRFQNRHRDSKK